MLRVHCLQQWYNLSDVATEDSLYEIASMRCFSHLALDRALPDHTTVMKFHYLLEKHHLGCPIFDAINQYLEESGLLMKEGSSIDTTIIEAPYSTKNILNQLDPGTHQTKKGNQWYFGIKAQIGVDVKTGLAHTFTTAANVNDLIEAYHLSAIKCF
jgi:IS5 family transposase